MVTNTPRIRFVLASESRSGPAHALAERSDGPALCGAAEPSTGWVLAGFTAMLDLIGCAICRKSACRAERS